MTAKWVENCSFRFDCLLVAGGLGDTRWLFRAQDLFLWFLYAYFHFQPLLRFVHSHVWLLDIWSIYCTYDECIFMDTHYDDFSIVNPTDEVVKKKRKNGWLLSKILHELVRFVYRLSVCHQILPTLQDGQFPNLVVYFIKFLLMVVVTLHKNPMTTGWIEGRLGV